MSKGPKSVILLSMPAESSLPIIAESQVLVAESTLAGCALALDFARQGKRVILASSSASLGHEIAVCMRPWAESAQLRGVPEPFRAWLRRSSKPGGQLDLVQVTEGL